VLTAENGTDGLRLFEKEKAPIVVTDIKMPGIDGIELLRRIKEMDRMTEVIMITGHGDMDLALMALDVDATDFINKPIQRPALDSALRRAEYWLKLSRDEGETEVRLRKEKDVALMDIEGKVTSQAEAVLAETYEKTFAEGVQQDRDALQ
jgi:YesN/AraC family two-component response regulator